MNLRLYSKHKKKTYDAKPVDSLGFAPYTPEEHAVWNTLYIGQIPLTEKYTAPEFQEGLELLKITPEQIPQCPDINEKLAKSTGWAITPVEAIIPETEFFQLLENKKFPAATFIRRLDDFDYIQEPDIFHEIFGHCPLLTQKDYASFSQAYGKIGGQVDPERRKRLARLYWFTVEFGLIETAQGIRAYGGGIISSPEELPYSVDSPIPERKPFDLLEILRTPFRIDQLQKRYFVLEAYDQLYEAITGDIHHYLDQALTLGDLPPYFDTDDLI